ncbi:hypothetical protein, partial [Lentimicrobium sp.]
WGSSMGAGRIRLTRCKDTIICKNDTEKQQFYNIDSYLYICTTLQISKQTLWKQNIRFSALH